MTYCGTLSDNSVTVSSHDTLVRVMDEYLNEVCTSSQSLALSAGQTGQHSASIPVKLYH